MYTKPTAHEWTINSFNYCFREKMLLLNKLKITVGCIANKVDDVSRKKKENSKLVGNKRLYLDRYLFIMKYVNAERVLW